MAAFLGLKAFVKNSDTRVKILSDNTATVYGINKIGSKNYNTCHKITCDIWDWTEQNNIWTTAAYIPGKYNDDADKESRKIRERDKEWEYWIKMFFWKNHTSFLLLFKNRSFCFEIK